MHGTGTLETACRSGDPEGIQRGFGGDSEGIRVLKGDSAWAACVFPRRFCHEQGDSNVTTYPFYNIKRAKGMNLASEYAYLHTSTNIF